MDVVVETAPGVSAQVHGPVHVHVMEPGRPVGLPFAGVRPWALALVAGEDLHARLVGGACCQVGKVDGRCRRRQRAGLLAVGAAAGVVRPVSSLLALGGLLAVLRLVAGDGQAVRGGGGPGHVQPRVHRHIGRRAGHGGSGRPGGLDVGHDDVDVDDGGVAVHGVVHLATVELGDHLAVPRLGLAVRVVRLVVDACALGHADLAAGRVDGEQPGVPGLALQRVAQRHAVERRPRHRGPDRRARGGVLNDAPGRLRGDGDGRAAGDLSPVAVAGDVEDLRRALVEKVRRHHGASGRARQADPEQGGVLRGGGVGQGVAVSVGEEGPTSKRRCLVPREAAANTKLAAAEEDAGSRRRAVGQPGPAVRPGAGAIQVGHGPHPCLVGGPGLEVGEVDAGRRRRERARDHLVCVGGGVVGPGRGVRTLGGLLAVLDVVAGDGRAAVDGGGGPRHVEGRCGRFAELRAGERRRGGLGGAHVGHIDGDGDLGVLVPVHDPVHPAGVGARGLVVQRRAFRHADLAGGVVDGEGAGVRRITIEPVRKVLIAAAGGGDRRAHLRSGGGGLRNLQGHVPRAGDLRGSVGGPAVGIRRCVLDVGRGGIEDGDGQHGPLDADADDAGVGGGGRVRQRVAVRILEVGRSGCGEIVLLGFQPRDRRVRDGRYTSRRAIDPPFAAVRPRAEALVVAAGAHLDLVSRGRLHARQGDGQRRRGQHAGRVAVADGVGVRRPRSGVLARRGLLAVLHHVPGGRIYRAGPARGRGGGGPTHVQGRAGRRAGRGASHRGSGGLPGLDIRHADGEVDDRGPALDGPAYLPGVGLRGLVVQAHAFLHADPAGGRVDDERVRHVPGERVGQRLVLVGSAGRAWHAHQSPGRGTLGDAAGPVRGGGHLIRARHVTAVGVTRPVGDR